MPSIEQVRSCYFLLPSFLDPVIIDTILSLILVFIIDTRLQIKLNIQSCIFKHKMEFSSTSV